MPIKVICPGCSKRFNVSEKFAGKKGPCPQCKAEIKIPEVSAEEVVVHAPDNFGPKDSEGRSVLKPIEREEFSLSTIQIVIAAASVFATLCIAVVLRLGNAPAEGETTAKISWVILGLGAVVLGPPLAMSAYVFLRDDELEPYRGKSLWLRSLVCGVCFAVLWGAYAAVKWFVLGGDEMQLLQLSFIVPPLLFGGAVAAWASYDLDIGNGAFAFAMYLGVTVVLRMILNIGPF